MSAANFLLFRAGIAYFNWRVSPEYLEAFGCQNLRISLRTSDTREAARGAWAIWSNLQHLLLEADKYTASGFRDEVRKIVSSRGAKLARPFPVPDQPPALPPLGELLDKWLADNASLRPTTLKAYKAASDLLRDYLGQDYPVRNITRQQCSAFVDVLKLCPSNRTKRAEWRGMSLCDLAEAGVPEAQRIQANTINSNLTRLASFYGWLIRHGWTEGQNPFTGLQVRDYRRADEERDSFAPEELRTLFALPVWTQHKFRDAWQFWLPLVGGGSGLRLEEIAGLSVGDVRQVDGVWVLDLNERSGRQLKNKAARRVVPIHSELLRLGFLRYVDERKAACGESGGLLFAGLIRNKLGRLGDRPSKWFNRTALKLAGIGRDGLVFHSLRHFAAGEMLGAKILPHVAASVLGHSAGELETHRYAGASPVSLMAEAIEAIRLGFFLEQVKEW